MNSNQQIIEIAKRTLEIESNAIQNLITELDEHFSNLVEQIYNLKGRVIISGVGKSAIIAQKIVATLNSTGTPSIFMHAADAIHGDLGMIQKNDIIICISKSGNTPEIKVLVQLLKQADNLLACFVGDKNSYLAQMSDFVISTFVNIEACPHNLAPTTSTTAQLAMGDALAICLLEKKSFSEKDFAKFHPGGSLGKRLYLKVNDLSKFNEKPWVLETATIKEVILEITKRRLGIVAVLSENNKLLSVITDGDLRRMMERHEKFDQLSAKDIMGKYPITIDANELAISALDLMRINNITQVIVTNNGNFDGVVHLHDLLKEGII